MHTITVEHNFEAGHRLPHLGGKCQSLHGHSWRVAATIAAHTLTPEGTIIDFTTIKGELRAWIDLHLDHGVMLGAADPLLPVLDSYNTKVFMFGGPAGVDTLYPAVGLEWPTVENVAVLLSRVASAMVEEMPVEAWVRQVTVRETATNQATWIHP